MDYDFNANFLEGVKEISIRSYLFGLYSSVNITCYEKVEEEAKNKKKVKP